MLPLTPSRLHCRRDLRSTMQLTATTALGDQPMSRNNLLRVTCTLLASAALVGCSSTHTAPASASFGDLGNQPPASISLGAGDTLGRAVYVNDLILAAAAL